MSSQPPSPTADNHGLSLLRSEDFWALWVVLALVGLGIATYIPATPSDLSFSVSQIRQQLAAPVEPPDGQHSVSWYLALDALNSLDGSALSPANERMQWVQPPHPWSTQPQDALWLSAERAAAIHQAAESALQEESALTREMYGRAVVAEAAARESGFRDESLNLAASIAVDDWREQHHRERDLRGRAEVQPHFRLGSLLLLALFAALILSPIVQASGGGARSFLRVFLYLLPLVILARTLAAQQALAGSGLSYPLVVILVGFLAGRLLPRVVDAVPALRPGLFLKMGLMFMAAQAVLPRLGELPVAAVITLLALLIMALLLWLLLPALLNGDSLRAGPLLALDIGVGGHSALLGLGAMMPLRSQALVLILLLSSLWGWLAVAWLPGLLQKMNISEAAAGLLLFSHLDPTVAESSARLLDDVELLMPVVVAAKWTLFALLAVLIGFVASLQGEEQQSTGSPVLMAGAVLFVIGIMSLLYVWRGPDWAAVMLDRGLIPGWFVPLRDWCFSFALLAFAMRARPAELLHTAGQERVAIVYVGGQLIKLMLLLALVVLLV